MTVKSSFTSARSRTSARLAALEPGVRAARARAPAAKMPSAAIDPLGAVRRPDRDPVARLDAARDQRAAGAVGLLGELRERRARPARRRAPLVLAKRSGGPGHEPRYRRGQLSSVMPTTCHDESPMRMPEPESGRLRDAPGRAAGSGRVARLRPARGGQRDERRDDGRARAGLAGARRRSRGAGHREHRRGQRVPDRARHGPARPRSRGVARAVPAHEAVRAAVHGVAQRRVEAGDRRGQRCVRGRGTALRRRRRHRHRLVDATFVDPHVSVGQATVYETIALAKKSPMEPCCAWRSSAATNGSTRAARVRARHLLAGRRPARAAPRRGAGARRADRAQLARRARAHEARAVGRAGTRGR